jgi:hypothetical protein
LTKYIFKKGWLSEKYAIFKCVVNIPAKTDMKKTDDRNSNNGQTKEDCESHLLSDMSTTENVETGVLTQGEGHCCFTPLSTIFQLYRISEF